MTWVLSDAKIDPLSSTLALKFTLDVDTTGSQAKTRFRFCGSVDRLLIAAVRESLYLCFMTNIKVTNMKNTAGKSARVGLHG